MAAPSESAAGAKWRALHIAGMHKSRKRRLVQERFSRATLGLREIWFGRFLSVIPNRFQSPALAIQESEALTIYTHTLHIPHTGRIALKRRNNAASGERFMEPKEWNDFAT